MEINTQKALRLRSSLECCRKMVKCPSILTQKRASIQKTMRQFVNECSNTARRCGYSTVPIELTIHTQKKQHNEKRAFRPKSARVFTSITLIIMLRVCFYLPENLQQFLLIQLPRVAPISPPVLVLACNGWVNWFIAPNQQQKRRDVIVQINIYARTHSLEKAFFSASVHHGNDWAKGEGGF